IVILLGLTLVLCTLAFGGVHYWAYGLLSAGAAATIILWSVDSWMARGLSYRASWLPLPLVAVILLGLVQLLPWRRITLPGNSATFVSALSFDPYSTRMVIVLLLSLLVFFAAALAFFDSRRRLKSVVTLLMLLGAAIAVLGLVQHFVSPLKIYGVREPNQALPFGPFINRNHFAAFLVMIVPIPLALVVERAVDRDRLPLYGFAILLMVVATLMTGSRGGLLTLVLAGGFLLATRSITRIRSPDEADNQPVRRRLRVAKIALAVGGALLVIGLLLLLGGGGSLRRILGQTPTEDVAAGGRTHYWKATARMFWDHPIAGVGLEGFGMAFPRYDTLNGTYRVERAHNDYLQTLAETGLIGSLCALAFIVILFRQGWALLRQTNDPWRRAVVLGALAGCFGVLVHSFFEFPLRTPANALLFLLLAVLATVEVGRRQTGKTDAIVRKEI
ncbi:MAG: O-antigen ligase family protein, partial [Pyrinomonadaceae bacterium]